VGAAIKKKKDGNRVCWDYSRSSEEREQFKTKTESAVEWTSFKIGAIFNWRCMLAFMLIG